VLNTQWTIIQKDRAARARREGLEEDEDGSDYEDGYCLDKYSDEEIPFELDKANLRMVMGRNNSISIGEGYDDDHGNRDDNKEQSDMEYSNDNKEDEGKNGEDEGNDDMGAVVNRVTRQRKSQRNRS
jgi:hypothetical protein